MHAPVGTIVDIPIGDIRPFQGQPRKYFESTALQELADSIKSQGQKTPAWVVPVHDEVRLPRAKFSSSEPIPIYELTAGERRWRACALASVPTLRCEVRAPAPYEERYVQSVMENFGRKDCTIMESARAVAEVWRIEAAKKTGGDLTARLANIFARSKAWVTQYKGLTTLHADVQAMVDSGEIKLQVALALVTLSRDAQVRLAGLIAGQGMHFKSALTLIRNTAMEDGGCRAGKRRRPYESFGILKRFLESLGHSTQQVAAMNDEQLRSMFASRLPSDAINVRKLLLLRARQLEKLERRIAELVR
jgi:ParB family chromosome partitioning protein